MSRAEEGVSPLHEQKSIVFLRGLRSAKDIHAAASAHFEDRTALSRLAVDVVLPQLGDEKSAPDYHVVVEAWGEPAEVSGIAMSAWLDAEVQHGYIVEERVEKGAQALPGLQPGVKVIASLTRRAQLDEDTVHSRWDAHVPLALREHVGMSGYIRNRVISAAPGTPDRFGVAMLRFTTSDDARLRYFREPMIESRERIRSDVTRFVGSTVKLFTHERVWARV